MVKIFNETKGKEPGLYANSVFQGSDTAGKLKTLIQTKDVTNMPDVCLVYGASLPVVASSENKVAIDSMYGLGTASDKKEDINQSALQTFTYRGEQLCMPFNSSTLLLYYNTDAFKEAGLDAEKPPKTLDEIADSSQAFTLALEQFESSNPMVQEPVMMMQGAIDEIIKEASVNVAEGSMTAEEAAAYVTEQCNLTFSDYNKANQ